MFLQPVKIEATEHLKILSQHPDSRGAGEPQQSCLGEIDRHKSEHKPFFLGPLQMTASSGLLSKKPTDITPRLSSRNWRG